MNRVLGGTIAALAVVAGFRLWPGGIRAQQTQPTLAIAPSPTRGPLIPAAPLYNIEDSFLRWPLPVSEKQYGSIDGGHLKGYVKEVVEISRRSRERGDKLWGRIIGTQADAESEQWLADKLRKAGVPNVRSEVIPLPPQWFPQAWEVTASSAGKTLRLETAQPSSGETPAAGLDLDAAWVGLGTAADFTGRDVKGKVVFIHAVPYPSVWRHSATIYGALERAQKAGAAAIVTIIALPGNVRTQRGHTRAGAVPILSMGLKDGETIRQMIEEAPSHQPPRVRVRLEGKEIAGLKTANVWGELPGTTDEKIIILAHRDGYFDAASDNASGLATMVGLAEYFAKIPNRARRRTIYFVGTPGHHGNVGLLGARALLGNKDTALAKTALIINAEHTASVQLYSYGYGPEGGPIVRKANTPQAFWWYAGGTPRFQQLVLKAFDTFGVATYEQPDPWAQGEMGEIYQFGASVQLIEANMYYHSDHETLDTVPAVGLEATTRAYAKIIDQVNVLDLNAIVPPQAISAQR